MVIENQGGDNGGSTSSGADGSSSESTGAELESGDGNPEELSADAKRETADGSQGLQGKGEKSQKEKEALKYTPNYKFKVMDKENEFDPWLKPIIKDADTEKKVRELYEKAYGLDYVKQSREQLEQRYNDLAPKAENNQKLIDVVTDRIAKKDFDSVFQGLGINDDDVLRQALKIIQVREMTPEQRAQYNATQEANLRTQMLEQQNQHLMSTNEQISVQARTQELDWTLQRPDLVQIASAYDQRVGTPGAFKAAIIERGKYHALVNKVDLTPEQVAQDVIKFLGGPQALLAPVVSQPQAAPSVTQAKPVITNIQGKGTSPAKQMPRRIKDLKKIAKDRSLAANE